MAKKKYYAVFDTETVGLKDKLIYDLAVGVYDREGRKYSEKQWSIKEVLSIPNIENIAYYGAKIPVYYKDLERFPFAQARQEFNELLDKFEVTTIAAYNLQFDINSLTDTMKYVGIARKFLTRPIDYFCLWNACCDSIFKQKQYAKIAKEQGWIKESGNFMTNAEVAYRFITKKYDFIESHTALEDVQIEAKIMQELFRQKKKIVRNEIVSHPWRKAQIHK